MVGDGSLTVEVAEEEEVAALVITTEVVEEEEEEEANQELRALVTDRLNTIT